MGILIKRRITIYININYAVKKELKHWIWNSEH